MKTLLVAINASFSHTCLSVRALYNYVIQNEGQLQSLPFPLSSKSSPQAPVFSATPSSGLQSPVRNACSIDFVEFTINQPVIEIIRGIAAYEPELVLFSTYIWNSEMVSKIIPDIKKILPEAVIGAGGPEFGYAPEYYLQKLSDLDFVSVGEGERIVKNLYELFVNEKNPIEKLSNIKGLFIRNKSENGKILFTGAQELICDLSELPFAYPEIIEFNQGTLSKDRQQYLFNKIYYYESNRGCPYSCSYCMSSLDKKVRFMPLERVYRDLQIFLDAGIPLVKFVDRTYNLNTQRYLAIWQYILDHHNGITMFHFEIEAEYLAEEAIEFLQKVPAGIMQFEIGVQSANPKTLKAVSRSTNVDKLAENVMRVPSTIHQHLDLIAGLPYENLESFGNSFDFVMKLKPDALQLGFLKVLHGTQMENYALENGWKWMEYPPYETFSTPYLSFKEMLFLKDLEVLLDAFWNSGKFMHLMNYAGPKVGWWNFFYNFTKWAQQQNVFEVARRETYWFELFYTYAKACPENFNECSLAVIYDLLRYDFVIRGKQGGWPQWYEHRYDKARHRELLEQNGGFTNARVDFGHSEYEVFDFNVDAEFPEQNKGVYEKLIRYQLIKN